MTKNIRSLRLLVLMPAFILLSCATVSSNSERFVESEQPSPGYARLYIFRPGFSSVDRYDSPTLLVNQKEVGRISYESYLSLMYRPGIYQIASKPNVIESSAWNASTQISLEADKTYFLAIWNNAEIGKGIGLMPIIGRIPFSLALPTETVKSNAVRFEVVNEEQAIPVITGYSLISLHEQQ
ncbi:hypothetical protein ACFQUU_22920 [Herbaspirillum sp. GCM10030257]|uniref:hypothetical protein n=1 Tax=Herbaspirillum sp. GCM10030257 TaxID=3273393 RepID=UPI00361D7A59